MTPTTSEWTHLYGNPRPTLAATLAKIATGDGLFVLIGLFFLGGASSVLLGWVTPIEGQQGPPQAALVAVLFAAGLGLLWAFWRIAGSLRDAVGPQTTVEGVPSDVQVLPTVPQSYRFTLSGRMLVSPLDEVEAPLRAPLVEELKAGQAIRAVVIGGKLKQLWKKRA